MKYWFGFSGLPRTAAGWLTGLVVVVFLAGLPSSPAVLAQSADLEPLLQRIKRLERDIRTLNLQISKGGLPAATTTPGASSAAPGVQGHALARMEVRLTSLEEEVRLATGQAESVSYQLSQIKDRIEKLVSDVDYRLSALEQRTSVVPGGVSAVAPPAISAAPSPPSVQTVLPGTGQPGILGQIAVFDAASMKSGTVAAPGQSAGGVSVAAVPASVLPEGTPKERYAYAFSLLRKNDFDAAEVAFTAFIENHGDDPLAANARYWLGDTHYVRGEYVNAAEVYLRGYQTDPKGNKAPDTLLKLGMSLVRLEKKKEACAAFAKLSKEFPEAPARIKRAMEREKKNSACK